jgi:hypothetical protein
VAKERVNADKMAVRMLAYQLHFLNSYNAPYKWHRHQVLRMIL